jgi:hypothetical protein
MYQSFLSYQRARWLWVALIVAGLSIVGYGIQAQNHAEPPNGGTAIGYVLGTIGAGLILWLLYFGRRKRDYASNNGTVHGWLSAHVYLGTALLFVATLHSGLQFGMNVHTLFYVLMCLVIFSGMFGVWAYMHYPSQLSVNNDGRTVEEMCWQVADIDKQIRRAAERVDPNVRLAVGSALDRTAFGGSAWAQLTGRDSSEIVLDGNNTQPNPNQKKAIERLANRLSNATRQEELSALSSVMDLFGSRNQVLRRIRRSIQIQAILRIWLYVHVPLSFATVAAMVVHVISVFLYW